jgi:DNA-binding transcriptional ArsR family regulator
MKEGPDIAVVAAMIGDPARANIILALMSGLSLSATELAREAGIGASTASSHLAKLQANGLISATSRGRHRYFSVANADVAHAVEGLVTIAARAGHMRTRPGPKDFSMRHARSCYDHLGGELAVALFDDWLSRRVLGWRSGIAHLTAKGETALAKRGIDVEALKCEKRPLCRTCIDWSERKNHLGGSIGAAIFALALENRWAVRDAGTRAVTFSPNGERKFVGWYSG